MSLFRRWWKFNLVGGIGMAVQLGAFACLNRIARGHYLLASATAVELAVLHNFAWHLHYTWRDRRNTARWVTQLLRFHLSNGLVSLAGNVMLMRTFVHRLHLHLMPANIASIAVCSLANFALSDRWAFGQEAHETTASTPASRSRAELA